MKIINNQKELNSAIKNNRIDGDVKITEAVILPDNLSVGGYLDLEGTGITQLPDNLSVGGSLYLRGTGITQLPDNLSVGGYLDLRGTGITQLPEGLTCDGIKSHGLCFSYNVKDGGLYLGCTFFLLSDFLAITKDQAVSEYGNDKASHYDLFHSAVNKANDAKEKLSNASIFNALTVN
jgi:hypothetical protein